MGDRKGPKLPDGPPPPSALTGFTSNLKGRLSGSFRRKASTSDGNDAHHGHHLHMPHLHMPHLSRLRGNSQEFGFDHPSDDESDTSSIRDEDTASIGSAEAVEAKKVKGGVHGAGAAVAGKIRDKNLCERIFIATLAVMMLWLTSYALAKALVEYMVFAPAFEAVTEANTEAYETSGRASDEYMFCVGKVADDCDSSYAASLAAENDRRFDFQSQNANSLNWLEGNYTLLKAVHEGVLAALAQQSSLLKKGTPTGGLTSDVCDLVDGLVSGSPIALNALQQASAFKDTADRAVRSRAQQIRDRQAYDERYFREKREGYMGSGANMSEALRNPSAALDSIGGSIDEVRACFGGPGNNGTGTVCPEDSVYNKYTDSVDEVTGTFNQVESAALAYKTQVESELAKFQALITKVGEWEATLLIEISDPEPGDADAPTTLNSYATLDNIADLLPDDAFAGTGDTFNSLTAAMDALSASEAANYNAVVGDSAALGSDFDTSYNPPAVDPDSAESDWDTISNSFLPGVTNDVGNLDDSTQTQQSAVEDTGSNYTDGLNSTTESVFSSLTDHSVWGFYTYGDDVVENIQNGVSDLNNVIIMFDVAFRALRTIFIIRKYWNLSGIQTPAGDARVKASAGKGWGPKQTPVQKVAAILTNPIFLALVTTTFVVVMLNALWYMYSPIFYEYVDGCVRSTPAGIDAGDATGTMLYRNSYELSFQYAAADGDKLATDRVDALNVARDLECANNGLDDTVLFNAQVDKYNKLAEELFFIVQQRDALVGCLRLGDMDPAIEAEATRVEWGYTHAAPVQDSIFRCDAVTGCDAIRAIDEENPSPFTCAGPDRAKIKSTTHEAACTTENWMHANLFGTFMLISTFILTNLGRMFFMRGIVRLSWRHLATGPFSFLGSTDDFGRVMYPERVTEKGDSMRVAIKEAVKLRLKQWERWAWLILFTGIALQVPWVWGLLFLSENLTYTAGGQQN